MALRCLFRYDDASYCKRWAKKDSRYCHAHRPPAFHDPAAAKSWPGLHPFTRLAQPGDLFDLLRESLNAARMGTMSPGQAASIATLSNAWLKAYDRLGQHERLQALDAQILPTLMDAQAAAEAERIAASTDETERAADLIAELDHIADFGPPASQPDDPAAQLLVSKTELAQTPKPAATATEGPLPGAGGHGFSHATRDGAQAPTPLPKADAESAAVGQTERHSVVLQTPRQPINLREAQTKLEAMLAEQRAANSPANPHGG